MDLGDFVTQPAVFEAIDDTRAYLTITEGKFHQVKRMFEAIGCPVTYLRRESFSILTLEDLETGQYRALTANEIELLQNQ
jgi:16S rRNA pseudouridine516 synthase